MIIICLWLEEMSCNYADGLSDYQNKGVLGVPEVFDDDDTVDQKCEQLAKMIQGAEHVVVHTGAGISTSAGIPDFRGPKGVWTLERKGEKPTMNVAFDEAIPTKTHMGLKRLVEAGFVKYIVSQNIDGLHLRSGLERKHLAELHGNMFIEQCLKCRRQYVRSKPAPTVGKKLTGAVCKGTKNSRACRGGNLIDNILDWEHDLPEDDLDLAFMHSALADLNICLGTTLQIVPSGNLPLRNKRYGGKLVICNLQPTKHDKKADLIISTYVDTVIEKVAKRLGVEIPPYTEEHDPTKDNPCSLEWTIPSEDVKALDKQYSKIIREKSNVRKQGLNNSFKDEMEDFVLKSKKLKKEEVV
ncbi:NAD-dependent protein deacetylase Sirt6-like [Topomyia yanbarensis]|uniref:NAD-dependent protein deacetylase Sirt6-like n=1 Tax=Topomyia yanbarensis TaxID=2498891 RepID=UPI00273C8AC8|nr:NAD-dependent protein deacetylase Sirt6-like [Topomyia yanbarensis]XP_058840616.1 NAD-dependent protein deacetylase Sirt6-like [Topomyia yanbarensis]